MRLVTDFIDVILHLDAHLAAWTAAWGALTYLLLFVIVFCETGLVVTPFLPGDSLLFACGALAALPGGGLDPWLLMAVLVSAAVLGDAANYSIGKWFGTRLLERKWLNVRHYERARGFYERHGAKAIVLARFAPILRTFAPFVAGIARMGYRRFAIFNIVGGLVWVCGFVALGYWFGNLPTVRRNFQLVIAAIIVLSLIPVALEAIRARRAAAVRT